MKKTNDTLSDDQKAKNKEIRAGVMADEEKKEEVRTQVAANFATADANGDGVLDRAEFGNFLKAWGEGFVAKG